MVFSPPPPVEDDEDDYDDRFPLPSSKGKDRGPEEEFGMVPIPMTPGSAMFPMSPMTPRTKAFNALDGAPSARKPMFPPPPKKEGKKKAAVSVEEV
jgi:hypothetical protein